MNGIAPRPALLSLRAILAVAFLSNTLEITVEP